MVGHYVGARGRSFSLALRVPCSDDSIVVLNCISVSAEGQITSSEYLSLADRNILCYNISDGTSYLAHLLLELLGFFPFCLELSVQCLLFSYEIVSRLLGLCRSGQPGPRQEGERETFFLAPMSFWTALTCLARAAASKSTGEISEI
jgi:hypothetical protein